MLGKCLCLLSLLLVSFQAWALSNELLLQNITSRMRPLQTGGSLIQSYTDHSQSYIYDQALAIIALSKARDQKSARKLLVAMSNLQHTDGSLYFSYYLDGKSPYPTEGDKRFAGAMAWVALAAVSYQHQFKSKEFISFNHRILKYLDSQMKPFKLKGKTKRALSFAPQDLPTTEWKENEIAALEHNLDAYAAFLHFAQVNRDKKWENNIKDLKSFIVAMWDDSRSHFWSGVNLKNGVINKLELYLDNQTWTLLALDQVTLKALNTKDALAMNCELFLNQHEGIIGLMDSKPVRRPASHKFVWSEGTAGQILAMKKVDQKNCKGQGTESLLSNLQKMKKADGGIAYATASSHPDFSAASSVAGTVWFYFASHNINPFHLDHHN